MKTRVLIAALGVLFAGLLIAPADAAAPLPACHTTTQLDCQGTTAVTYANQRRGGQFCQIYALGVGRCESYWPFTNPTINPQAAVGDEPSWVLATAYMTQMRPRADRTPRLEQKVDRQQHRIARQHRTIQRLRHRLHHHH